MDPVAGALVGTIILVAFLAPPVLILALIVWLAVRAERKSSQGAKKPPRKRARSASV
jgi:cytochrome c oxidase assembly factor CtaG